MFVPEVVSQVLGEDTLKKQGIVKISICRFIKSKNVENLKFLVALLLSCICNISKHKQLNKRCVHIPDLSSYLGIVRDTYKYCNNPHV